MCYMCSGSERAMPAGLCLCCTGFRERRSASRACGYLRRGQGCFTARQPGQGQGEFRSLTPPAAPTCSLWFVLRGSGLGSGSGEERSNPLGHAAYPRALGPLARDFPHAAAAVRRSLRASAESICRRAPARAALDMRRQGYPCRVRRAAFAPRRRRLHRRR